MDIAAKLRTLKNANYRETEVLTLPDGIEVVLSTLTGAEDKDMADYLSEYLGPALGHYTKLESLCYSIKWLKTVDGEEIDLRNLGFIETSKVLDNEKRTPVRVRRNVFMREIVHSWPDVVVDTLFAKYAQMMEELDKDTGKGVKVELGPDALRAKVLALGGELADLVAEARTAGVELPDNFLDFRHTVSSTPETDQLLEAMKAAPTAPEEEVHPIDEQLERERREAPEVYPVTQDEGLVAEDPKRVRK